MTQLLVRPMTVADVDAVANLHVSTWRETYSGLIPQSFFAKDVVEYRRRWWSSTIADTEADQVFRVAEIDGQLVGFAGAGVAVKEPAPRPLELYMIYLAKAAHGSGIGQQLLDGVLPPVPAFLWVARDNPRARAFYVKNGFVADGTEFTDPRTPDFVEMRMVR